MSANTDRSQENGSNLKHGTLSQRGHGLPTKHSVTQCNATNNHWFPSNNCLYTHSYFRTDLSTCPRHSQKVNLLHLRETTEIEAKQDTLKMIAGARLFTQCPPTAAA
mmetsp:Transcript_10820/g.25629  ORF Transcript_10820/g.25629 Transcript_10820/m.25629 type:complete len:107 (+) Transcript_10820:1322-1642(+)